MTPIVLVLIYFTYYSCTPEPMPNVRNVWMLVGALNQDQQINAVVKNSFFRLKLLPKIKCFLFVWL